MDYESKTKADLMEILDSRGAVYRKKDTKPALIQICKDTEDVPQQEEPVEEDEYTNEETIARAKQLSKALRSAATELRSRSEEGLSIEAAKAKALEILQRASSAISKKDIKKHWDHQAPPHKARERAIKLARRKKKSKMAKESRRANRT
jgi:hypothetical protein